MSGRFKYLPTYKPYQIHVVTEDTPCGLCRFYPKWLQKYADPKVFLLVFSVLSIFQGAYFTYFIGITTTLEKRYGFGSQVTGVILTADTISTIFLSLFIGYFGTKAHKPRLITYGMFFTVLSCFLSTVPYFVYGPGINILSKPNEFFSENKREFCELKDNSPSCESKGSFHMNPVATLLFLANFLNGFGHTAFYVVGLPYLDDNIKKKNAPLYFGAMASLRIFGPALGFLLSSFCLKFYEDPFYDPGIDPLNPRWVGAWWMGFLILGVILLFFTILLALFPRELPERFRSEKNEKEKTPEQDKSLPKLKDFPREMKRLMKNPILVCHVISITLQVNGFAGYFVFMPKFMESQYQKSASDASLFSGATGIISMLAGIMIGGFVIKKYKPRPRYLTGYMVLVEIFSVIGLLVCIFLGCPSLQMPGTNFNEDETLNLYNECNVGCSCTRRVFEPVCGEDGMSTYFSPCFAGCPNITDTLSSVISSTVSNLTSSKVFEECKCAGGFNNTFITSDVTSGFCSSTCTMFMSYIILLCISKFISSTARVGNTLIMFRCVDAKDKSFALGTFGSVLAVFAFIPYPLIYGALTDSACLVWEESCSKTGNCWLYDSDKFRYYLHGMSMLLISLGIFFDGIVFLLSDRMTNFYGENDENQGEDRIVKWLKEEEDEDIIFTKCPKRNSILDIDPVM